MINLTKTWRNKKHPKGKEIYFVSCCWGGVWWCSLPAYSPGCGSLHDHSDRPRHDGVYAPPQRTTTTDGAVSTPLQLTLGGSSMANRSQTKSYSPLPTLAAAAAAAAAAAVGLTAGSPKLCAQLEEIRTDMSRCPSRRRPPHLVMLCAAPNRAIKRWPALPCSLLRS